MKTVFLFTIIYFWTGTHGHITQQYYVDTETYSTMKECEDNMSNQYMRIQKSPLNTFPENNPDQFYVGCSGPIHMQNVPK